MLLTAVASGAFGTTCTQSASLPSGAISPPQPSPLTPTPRQLGAPAPFATPGMPVGTSNPWKTSAAPRQWKYIVVHHTATDRGSVESIDRVHRTRRDADGNAWLGIGYHFVIGNGNGMGDGEIEPTFRWREQLHGAHAGVAIYNEAGIGIALVGNFNDAPPSEAQLAAVKRLIGTLKSEFGITSADVVGHGDVKNTSCPGKYFPLADVSRTAPETFLGRGNAPARPVEIARSQGSPQP